MNYQLLNDTILRLGQTNFHPWPDFRVTGLRVDVPFRLFRLLHADETVAMLWRAKIPQDLLKVIGQFPDSELERLLHLSQLDINTVMDWAGFCPALLVLAPGWAPEDPLSVLETSACIRSGWRHVLEAAEWPIARSTLNILRKIPANACTEGNLRIIKAALENRHKRNALVHLCRINSSVIDLISLPAVFLNHSLLQTVSCMLDAPDNLSEICLDIDTLRTQLGIDPTWPFCSGSVGPDLVVRHLAKLERRIATGLTNENIELPAPPFSGIRAKNFHIEPLTTIPGIFREGHEMQNCIASYISDVEAGFNYVYRLLAPQRATVLLKRRTDDWYPQHARTYHNGAVEESTLHALHTFTGTFPEKPEIFDDDFPF